MEINSALAIENWMLGIIQDSSWQKYHDLHIDEIDHTLKKNPSLWCSQGCKFFEEAISIRDQLKLPFVVELVIQLKDNESPIGINFSNLQELERELTWTPPSLYIFSPDWEVWCRAKQKAIPLVEFGGCNIQNIGYYYLETLADSGEEYYRSLTLSSEPRFL